MSQATDGVFLNRTQTLRAVGQRSDTRSFPTPDQERINWCWAAVGSSLCTFHIDHPISQTKVARLHLGPEFETEPPEGTEQILIEVLEKLFESNQIGHRFRRSEVHSDYNGADGRYQILRNDLVERLEKRYPVPATIIWSSGGNWVSHFICIFDFDRLDESGLTFFVYDPASNDMHLDNIIEISAGSLLRGYLSSTGLGNGLLYDAYLAVLP